MDRGRERDRDFEIVFSLSLFSLQMMRLRSLRLRFSRELVAVLVSPSLGWSRQTLEVCYRYYHEALRNYVGGEPVDGTIFPLDNCFILWGKKSKVHCVFLPLLIL